MRTLQDQNLTASPCQRFVTERGSCLAAILATYRMLGRLDASKPPAASSRGSKTLLVFHMESENCTVPRTRHWQTHQCRWRKIFRLCPWCSMCKQPIALFAFSYRAVSLLSGRQNVAKTSNLGCRVLALSLYKEYANTVLSQEFATPAKKSAQSLLSSYSFLPQTVCSPISLLSTTILHITSNIWSPDAGSHEGVLDQAYHQPILLAHSSCHVVSRATHSRCVGALVLPPGDLNRLLPCWPTCTRERTEPGDIELTVGLCCQEMTWPLSSSLSDGDYLPYYCMVVYKFRP